MTAPYLHGAEETNQSWRVLGPRTRQRDADVGTNARRPESDVGRTGPVTNCSQYAPWHLPWERILGLADTTTKLMQW